MRILLFLPVGALPTSRPAPDPLGVLVADVQQKDVPLYLVKQEHTEDAFVREGQLFFQVEQIRKAGISPLAGLPAPKEMLAGEPTVSKLTLAQGNNGPMGGLKVNNSRGWFAARPSGTENVCKIDAESFDSEEHLNRTFDEVDGARDGEVTHDACV
jgi:phosphomannomutase